MMMVIVIMIIMMTEELGSGGSPFVIVITMMVVMMTGRKMSMTWMMMMMIIMMVNDADDGVARTKGQSGELELANSGMCSPQCLSIEGRKWKGFSSSLSIEDEEDNLLIFNEAEVEVFKIFEEGEGVVGFISFKEDVEKLIDGDFVARVELDGVETFVKEEVLVLLGSLALVASLELVLMPSVVVVMLLLLLELVLMLSVVVVLLLLLPFFSSLTGAGCMALADVSRWADMGQLCSVYGACIR